MTVRTAQGRTESAEPLAGAPDERLAERPIPRYRTVLLAEDEAPLRRVITRNLVGRGVRVREAETAGEAIRAVANERPDLLLLDIHLPDRSGWDVLRVLRAKGIEVPTIVVSAVKVPPGRLEEFRPLAYLPKPFPLGALLRFILGPSDGQETSSTR